MDTTEQRAGLAARLTALRREALDVLLEIRALDHAARAREARHGQAAPTRIEVAAPKQPEPKPTTVSDWG